MKNNRITPDEVARTLAGGDPEELKKYRNKIRYQLSKKLRVKKEVTLSEIQLRMLLENLGEPFQD